MSNLIKVTLAISIIICTFLFIGYLNKLKAGSCYPITCNTDDPPTAGQECRDCPFACPDSGVKTCLCHFSYENGSSCASYTAPCLFACEPDPEATPTPGPGETSAPTPTPDPDPTKHIRVSGFVYDCNNAVVPGVTIELLRKADGDTVDESEETEADGKFHLVESSGWIEDQSWFRIRAPANYIAIDKGEGTNPIIWEVDRVLKYDYEGYSSGFDFKATNCNPPRGFIGGSETAMNNGESRDFWFSIEDVDSNATGGGLWVRSKPFESDPSNFSSWDPMGGSWYEFTPRFRYAHPVGIPYTCNETELKDVQIVVNGRDSTDLKCTGNPDIPPGWSNCIGDATYPDHKEFTCGPEPVCTVSVVSLTGPDLYVDSDKIYTAKTTATNCNVVQVNFTINNANAKILAGWDVDNTPLDGWTSWLRGLISPGVVTLTATATTNTGKVSAPKTLDINVLAGHPPWWQVGNGNAISGETIDSEIPDGKYFMTTEFGNSPGIPIYGNSLGITDNKTSTTEWNAKSGTAVLESYDYNYFWKLANSDPDIPIHNLPFAPIYDLGLGACPELGPNGYCWISNDMVPEFAGNVGSKKIVIFNIGSMFGIPTPLHINNITVGNNGFLFILSITDIIVTSNTNNVQGLFLTDGSFKTETSGWGDDQLNIKGTVISKIAPSLNRDLDVAENQTLPAEIFTFDPKNLFNFPPQLIKRSLIWKEVNP